MKHIVDAGALDFTGWEVTGPAQPVEDACRDSSCFDETREAFVLLKLWLDEADEGETRFADEALLAALARVGAEALTRQFRLLAGVIFLWEEGESGRSRAKMLELWRARLKV